MAMTPELEKLYKDRLMARLEQEDADAARGWAGEGNYTSKFNRAEAEKLSYADLVKQWGGDDSGWSTGNSVVDESDPAMAAFRAKFGDGKFNNVELNNRALGNDLHFSYTKPSWFDDGAQDKGRIMQLDDGRWVWEGNNLSGDYVKDEQAKSADSGFFHGDAMDIVKVAAVFAAAYGAGALLEGGLAEAAPLQLSGPGSTMTGVTPGIEAATGLETAGAGAAAEGAGTVSTDGMWDIPGGDTIPPGEGATPPPTGTPPATPPGGPGAPPSAVTPPSGTGLVDSVTGAARSAGNAASGAWDWYNSLSPASRQILGSAVSMGARAALQQSAQQSALEAQRDAEERARQDKIRRGQVQAYGPSAFTPKPLPGGLINRNGG